MLALLLGGLILGALARLAVPGPDPMPIWFTIGIGLAGSIVAGVVGHLVFDDPGGGYLFGLLGAIGIVIGYRRLVQGRGITGPEARRRPRRGLGVRADLEEKLGDLHEAGVLTDEEFEAKRAEVRSRLP